MSIFTEPVVIEIILSLAITLLIALVVRRLLRIARRLDKRRALREFVRGMDSYLHGEHERAVEELRRVLERDPENVEARIALGDALRALGQAAEAHREHYHVQKVFGHDLPRNDLSLGRDLLALGDPEAAIPSLERALSRDPLDGKGFAELRDAYLAVGRYEEAVEAGRTVLERSGDEKEREEARRVLGRALALAGTAGLARGDGRGSAGLLEEAIRVAPELVQPRMELVRARLLAHGQRAGAKAFATALGEMRRLAEAGDVVFEPLVEGPAPDPRPETAAASEGAPGDPTPLLPGGGSPALLDAPGPTDERLPAVGEDPATRAVEIRPETGTPALPEDVVAPDDVAPLLDAAARAYCDVCGRPARGWSERCPGCGAYGSMRPRETSRLTPIANPRAVLAEIEETRGYVKALCRRLAEGREDALEPLARVGRRTVPFLFREALAAADPRLLVGCLARMGPDAVPSILEAWSRTRSVLKRRMFGEKARRRSADEIVARTLERMGRSAGPVIRSLLDRPEPEVRLLALDAMLRLGLLDLVEEARLLFGARDLVDRLNGLDPEIVRDIAVAASPESHLVRSVFVDRTFRHDEALVAATIATSRRDHLVAVLAARGFSAAVVSALLERADDPELREILVRLLDGFGPAAADHLVTAFVDPTLGAETRADVARLILRAGPPDLEKLLDGAADRPAAMGEAAVGLVEVLGDGVVPDLSRLYASGGWLSRIGLGRDKIHMRRRIIIAALDRLGTEPALMVLREIRMRETDPGLRGEADAALGRLENR